MRPKIYLFGDTITEESFSDGGGAQILHITSLGRGYGGYKVFPRPPEDGGPPLAVTVFFGACDASLPDRCSSFQHVPFDEYRQNLMSIVAFLKVMVAAERLIYSWKLDALNYISRKWASTCFLIITPPPIDEVARLRDPFVENKSCLPDRTNEATGRYAKQCLAVAAEFGVCAIDSWTKMQQFPGWQEAYLRDGLHLTPEGNKFVFEEVIGRLKETPLLLIFRS